MNNLVEIARVIAKAAHSGQTDKAGESYFFGHVSRVATMAFSMSMENDIVHICALLHDVAEDSQLTLGDISSIFGVTITENIDYLTRRNGHDYEEYISRVCSGGKIPIIVKKADLMDHLRDTSHITEKQKRKYVNALKHIYNFEKIG